MKFSKFIILLTIFLITFSVPTNAGSVWDSATETYAGKLNITVYHSPSCNCCRGWISHLKQHNFQIKDIKIDDVETIKKQNNLPQQLASCHTALINNYIIEGHVPADDIKRLLKQKTNIAGLAVPQMPVGTPGMDIGDKKEPFEVVSFTKEGKVAVFNQYRSY